MFNLLKGISWIFSANIVTAFVKWLILILIARILTPEDVGAYSLAFAFTAPITLFFNLKLRPLFVTENSFFFKDYIITRNTMSVVALIIIFILGLLVYPEFISIIILVGLNKIYDLHSELYYSIPQKYNKFASIGKLKIIKHIILLIFFSISLYLTKRLVVSFIIEVIAQIVYFYLIEKKIIRNKFSVRYNKSNYNNIKKVILIGLPLGLSGMMVSLTTNFPRYFLEYFESQEILGYFSAAAYILTVGNMVMSSVSQNFLPMLTKILKNNNIKAFKQYVFGYLTIFSTVLGLVLILGTYSLGGIFLEFVYGSNYAEYTNVLILMSYGMAINFVSWNFETALISMRYIKIQPKISLVTFVLGLIFGFILVGKYGINGAAYTIIVTNIVQLTLRFVFVVYGLARRLYS